MEDLTGAPGSPAIQDDEEPQGLNDPRDPLNPGVEEEDRPNAPLGDPTADVDAFEDEEAPETVEAMDDAAQEDEEAAADPPTPGADDDDDDDESELEELDETQFQDFDPSALQIPSKPVAVDESNVGLIGVHKRKRTEEEERERELKKKKKKESRREKPKRRKHREDEPDFEGGPEIDGKRVRKGKPSGERRREKREETPPEDLENLTPEERRRRALDKKMDEAVRSYKPNRRRRAGDIDITNADAEIETMRHRMAKACEQDAEARSRGNVATHKLAILPEVVELMNRNTIQTEIVDPDINLLEAVRFMLEPADHDAALPNYKIQRELFQILSKLNIGKEALVASGIGKVVLFYTKSIQPQPEIKRMAEKLVGEWMRVVLKKRKDLRNIAIETKTYDPLAASSQARNPANFDANRAAVLAERRRKALAVPQPGNRARVEGGVGTYSIAPVSTLSNAMGVGNRKLGASGEDAFRKIAARGAVKAGNAAGGSRKG